jgi:hypothetical protein
VVGVVAVNSKVGWRHGWGWTIGGGVLLGVLASFPSIDRALGAGVAWLFGRVWPWLLAAVLLTAVGFGVRWWWKGRGW